MRGVISTLWLLLSLAFTAYAGLQFQHDIAGTIWSFVANLTSIGDGRAQQNATQAQTGLKTAKAGSPWTRQPDCVKDAEKEEEYCVYTDTDFANGRGISFFTSPRIAKRVEKLPGFVRPEIYEKVNDFSDPPYEIRNVPGRGNGLFATRLLHRGDPIIAATPVGVYQNDALMQDHPHGFRYLRKTYNHLSNATKEAIIFTAAHFAGDPIMERINTNAFAGEFEGALHFLLYPETSLINHDCRPNAMYQHDQSTLVHASYASRTIQPGEEITITYINILQPRAERQSQLQAIWGFECGCALCSGSTFEVQASDIRNRRITEIQSSLIDWSAKSTGTPKLAEELMSLYEEEHIHAARGTGHMFIAMEYNAVGNTGQAKKHAKLAIKAGLVSGGPKGADEKEVKALIADPRKHWTFNKRKARKGLNLGYR